MARWLAFLLLLIPGIVLAQGVRYENHPAMKQRADGALVPVAATIAVCTTPLNTGTTPCSTLITTYTDATLSTPCTGTLKDGTVAGATNCSNPLITDSKGNYHFYSAPGAYTIQVYGSGITTSAEPDVPVGATAVGSIILACKQVANIRCVDATNTPGWTGSDLAAWIASAFASCTNSACTVLVENGAYATPSSSISVGVSPCVNYPGTQAQTLVFDTQVTFTINNKINVLCGGYLSGSAFGNNSFSGQITAGASLGTNPMVDVGDATNGAINAGVDYLRLDCASRAGCTGMRIRGTNDLSHIIGNIIQRYAVNGILMDGSVSNTGNTKISGNILSAAVGGGNAFELNSIGEASFDRNSAVSNSGGAVSAACFHIGGAGSPNNSNLTNFHCENLTDGVLVDNAAGLNILGLDVGGNAPVTNALHIAAGATGVITAVGIGSNTLGTNIVKNDITGNTLAIAAGQHQQIQRYSWAANSNVEEWVDTNGVHVLTPNGNLFLEGSSALRSRNTAATEVGLFGMDAFASGQWGFGTTTAHPLSFYTNSLRRFNIAADGGIGFVEQAAPAATATWDVCYGDSTAHALKCSYNNGSFLNTPQVVTSGTITLTSGAVTAATCQARNSTTATGSLTTDAVEWAYATAPTVTTDALLHVSPDVSSAGNIGFTRCNPTAGSITGTAIVINWRIIR